MVRFAGSCAAAALLVVIGWSNPAAAQELAASTVDSVQPAAPQSPLPSQPRTPVAARPEERRPSALIPLYASFVTLQVLDVQSTRYALDHGAVEANPAVKGLAGNTVAMAAMKAAGTAGVIFVSEKLRMKNKAAAIGLMIATNSAMTWVVQHNYRTVR